MPEVSVVCSGVTNGDHLKEVIKVLQSDSISGIIYRPDPRNSYVDVEFEGKHYGLVMRDGTSGNLELSSHDPPPSSLLESIRSVLRGSSSPIVKQLHIPGH